jgi:hypothetical protein
MTLAAIRHHIELAVGPAAGLVAGRFPDTGALQALPN